MSILLPDLEVGQLLGGGDKLNHLLTGSGELCGQPLAPLRLFDEAVPNVLLATKELELLPVVDHKGLQRG